MPKNIIWIASYPKSENTWIRALISAYLYSRSGRFSFSDLNKIEQFPNKKYLSSFLKNFDDPKKVNFAIENLLRKRASKMIQQKCRDQKKRLQKMIKNHLMFSRKLPDKFS